MENTPFYPENFSEDEDDSKLEKDSKKKKKAPKANFLDLLRKEGEKDKTTDKSVEIFSRKEKDPEDSKSQEKKQEKVEEDQEIEAVAKELPDESLEQNEEELTPEEQHEIEQEAELDSTEQAVIAEQLVIDRIEEAETELEIAEPGSDEEMEVTAAAAFLDRVGERLSGGQELNEETMNAAIEDVSSDLQLEGIPEDDPAERVTSAEDVSSENSTEEDSGAQAVEQDDDLQNISITPPAYGAPPAGGGGAGGGGRPPIPPSPGSMPPQPPEGGGFSGGHSGASVETIGQSAQVETDSTSSEEHGHGKYVLAGGLLGYLIGRRRGRIKTEKKLVPLQKKMEQNIGELNDTLLQKEQQIRKLVVANKQKLGQVNRDHVRERLQQERVERQQKIETLNSEKIEAPTYQPETISRRPVEQAPQPVEQYIDKTRERNTPLSDKQAIEIAKNIYINNQAVEQLFKRGRVELVHLKEIVNEYLKGGNYEALVMKHLKPEAQVVSPLETPETLPQDRDGQLKQRGLPTDLRYEHIPDFSKVQQVNPNEVSQSEQMKGKNQNTNVLKSLAQEPVKIAVGGFLILLVAALAAFIGFLITGNL